MRRSANNFLRFSALNSSRSGRLGYGLCLLALFQALAVAQNLTAPAASQAPLSAFPSSSSSPLGAPQAAVVASGAVHAIAPQAKPAVAKLYPWKNLSPAQQHALAPLEKDWGRLDSQRRRKWMEIATRFPTLPADEQVRMQERMSSWAKLSPTERTQARLIFQQAQRITPESRQAKWEAYQALAPEQRQDLAAKAAKRRSLAASSAPGDAAAHPKAARNNASHAARPALAYRQAKSNLVPDRSSVPLPKSVTPTLLQNKPGATTTLINQIPTPPAHQQSGLPKILAAPDLVDPLTLLPRRDAEGHEGVPSATTTPHQ